MNSEINNGQVDMLTVEHNGFDTTFVINSSRSPKMIEACLFEIWLWNRKNTDKKVCVQFEAFQGHSWSKDGIQRLIDNAIWENNVVFNN